MVDWKLFDCKLSSRKSYVVMRRVASYFKDIFESPFSFSRAKLVTKLSGNGIVWRENGKPKKIQRKLSQSRRKTSVNFLIKGEKFQNRNTSRDSLISATLPWAHEMFLYFDLEMNFRFSLVVDRENFSLLCYRFHRMLRCRMKSV